MKRGIKLLKFYSLSVFVISLLIMICAIFFPEDGWLGYVLLGLFIPIAITGFVGLYREIKWLKFKGVL